MKGGKVMVEIDKVGGACFYVVEGSQANKFDVRLCQKNDKLKNKRLNKQSRRK